MELFLIRHAQSQNNAWPESKRVEDPALTEVGHEQAKRLGEWLPVLGLTQLFTSPFRRALQTTWPIHRATGLVPQVRTELHEQGGCYRGYTVDNTVGRPGMTRAEIEQEFEGFRVADDITDDGWWQSKPYEHFPTARERALALLRWTQEQFAETDERVAFVSHADLKLLFLEHFHGEPLDCPCNTSITTVQIVPGRTQLTRFNRAEHLPPDLVTR